MHETFSFLESSDDIQGFRLGGPSLVLSYLFIQAKMTY